MLLNRFKILLILSLFALVSQSLFSQEEGVLDSEVIRQKFEEAKHAEQRIQTIVDEWKLEIKAMQEQINKLESDIQKNRLIWSDEERQKNVSELEMITKKKSDYAKEKFQAGGEFDKIVKEIQEPVEVKLNDSFEKMSE
ncbi:MAG: hypothetical protein CVV25_06675 [Ignavibacteriae bacterium HGW-Ignavibacteriae-4]|jgi:Skp family chaperone for outer membrane proteins|nr:MAG: hypothetical protein CVV25_06675 [Ignavibacteriae bacterium HGW-Ignavibacteriae-4]